MGKNVNLTSNPSLIESHEAGAKIQLVQPALHVTYGVLMVPRLILWKAHLNLAEGRYGQLRALDEQVLALPVGPSNTRFVSPDLAIDLYKVGTELVLHTILAVQQLVL